MIVGTWGTFHARAACSPLAIGRSFSTSTPIRHSTMESSLWCAAVRTVLVIIQVQATELPVVQAHNLLAIREFDASADFFSLRLGIRSVHSCIPCPPTHHSRPTAHHLLAGGIRERQPSHWAELSFSLLRLAVARKTHHACRNCTDLSAVSRIALESASYAVGLVIRR